MESKIYQPKQVEKMRSQINFANYNPRKITDKARKLLKKNLKERGLLGGIVFNLTTGNLISGHQRISIIDEVNRYNPDTKENDYSLRVEAVEMDLKTEKEQNIFMNNKSVQGEFEDEMLRDLLSGIDYEAAGLDDFDLQMLGIGDQTVDEYEYQAWNKAALTGENSEEGGKNAEQQYLTSVDEESKSLPEDRNVDRSVDFADDTPENQIARHNEVQKIKERINRQNDYFQDGGLLSYFIVSFENPDEKFQFLQDIGFEGDLKYIEGSKLAHYLEFGYVPSENDNTEEPTENAEPQPTE